MESACLNFVRIWKRVTCDKVSTLNHTELLDSQTDCHKLLAVDTIIHLSLLEKKLIGYQSFLIVTGRLHQLPREMHAGGAEGGVNVDGPIKFSNLRYIYRSQALLPLLVTTAVYFLFVLPCARSQWRALECRKMIVATFSNKSLDPAPGLKSPAIQLSCPEYVLLPGW